MPELWVAVYLSREPEEPPHSATVTATAFHAEARSGTFPYDVGDDPAFFSARFHDGPVTWGVCRRDVRSAIEPGDWVLFFSAGPDDRSAVTSYRFVAALQVQTKISQTAIFDDSANSIFENYLNLLLRPNGSGWEWHEPCLSRTDWHDDWLWRISGRGSLTKDVIETTGLLHIPGTNLPIKAAENYIIFSRSSSLIAERPPLVATHRPGWTVEEWAPDPLSRWIRNLVFRDSPRGLRINNRQPHRHFRRHFDEPSWPDAMRDALARISY